MVGKYVLLVEFQVISLPNYKSLLATENIRYTDMAKTDILI